MIYFAQCKDANGYIKIGRTTDLWRRIGSMQSDCPYEIVLLATLPGDLLRERTLHHQFKADHIKGEWFSPSPELMEVVASGTIHIKPEPLPPGPKLLGQYLYEDRDWLYQKYVKENMTTTMIASLLECSHQTVWLWLKKFDIPRRPAYRRSNH